MPYAVTLTLDRQAAAAVREVWQRLCAAVVSCSMTELGVEPHVSLAVSEEIEREAVLAGLAGFAASTAALPVQFDSVGFFPDQGVLFLAPKVTEPLLAAHALLHQRLRPHLGGIYAHFTPERWVPHCTLALSLDTGAMVRAVSELMRLRPHVTGTLTAVELVRFPPLERLFCQGLGA